MGDASYDYDNGHGIDVHYSYNSGPHYPPQPPHHRQRQNYFSDPEVDYDAYDSDNEFTIANNSYPGSPPNFNGSPRSNPSGSSTTTLAQTPLEALKARLLPLRHIEALLIAKLVPPNEEEATHLSAPGPYNNNHSHPSPTDSHFSDHITHYNSRSHGHQRSQSYWNQEIFVRPGPGWKGGLARARVNFPDYSSDASSQSSSSSAPRPMSAGNTGLESPDEPQEVLHSCRRDMIQLWNDDGIREMLRRKKVRLEEASGL